MPIVWLAVPILGICADDRLSKPCDPESAQDKDRSIVAHSARVKISGTHWKQRCNAFQCVPGIL